MSDSPAEAVAANGMPYSVRLEQTAKFVRVTVHVYGKDLIETGDQAIKLLENIVMTCESKGIAVQPLKDDVKEPIEVAAKK